MIRQMRGPWLWTNFTIILLGAWLISSPFTFGYADPEAWGSGVVKVTQERGLPSIAVRGWLMTWNDVASGALLVVFATVALRLTPRADFWGRWAVALVGTWLQFAPLVFWAPTAAAYVNDTLIGALAIALSLLVPMMPGMAHHMAMMKPGPVIPPGWNYNPSSWHQRAPLVALALAGWFISRYLAAAQLGYIERAWEPFFPGGTAAVLHSHVSAAFPISDAGLGAAAYTIELLMTLMGDPRRWRSMPWMVTFFGLLVIPLGVTHVILVVLQPVAVGAWCTLCLAAAATMLLMIPLAVDEVVAMGQFMVQAVRERKPFWWTFFVGDTIGGSGTDHRTPGYDASAGEIVRSMFWGVSLPWTLMLSVLLGIWLLFAPAVLGTEAAGRDSDRLTGAVVMVVSAIAAAEVTRPARFLNVLSGLWLVTAPWMLNGFTAIGQWHGVALGVVLIILSVSRGPVWDRYGSWDCYIV